MDTSKVVIFSIGKEEYGIPIQHVISIEKAQEATELPKMPSYVKGIDKIRGELVPVLDMNTILYDRDSEYTEKTRTIVVNTNELEVGFIVDDAKEILDVPEEKISQINLFAYQQTAYFAGVANLDGRLITMIDANKLLESLEGLQEIKEEMGARI